MTERHFSTRSVPSREDLLDPAFLARIDSYALRLGRTQRGRRLADQRTTARGQGTDFADFKPYVAGDDLRTIDWNIYRRIGKTFVRVFEEHHDLPVHVLVDCSGSMFAEDPPRIAAGLRAALAVAGVALAQHDTVSLHSFADRLLVHSRSLSGRSMLTRVADFLSQASPQGTTDLADAATRLGKSGLRPGLLVVISDFFADGGLDAALAALSRLPHRTMLVQMVRDYDAEPQLHPTFEADSDIAIASGEGGEAVAATMSAEVLDAYREAYTTFSERLVRFAAAHGTGLARIDCAVPVIDQLPILFGDGMRA
ncbi:DUF58 domain-containing protein [Aurantiacibacter xanthus]|uniref:DUF58 domain-containing protein n=1 Tax=Aurantiacibacter xanthus TaxID=1784712 RepID=A0A3A1P7R9_9SPHN|nr:DUF58 domain-containing protein [Aurantiacibacter xanthus]RIV89667.1 DUF58 domain-containing protein [Aurantiacibacter xanthus]